MPWADKAAQKADFETPLLARHGQFTDIHHGFHLRGLQAGDEGFNGQGRQISNKQIHLLR
ncbi:MAG: hypothetical protein H7293_20520 [Candidatus Saccharibacteria bacterium]|nr:hypothetical protein [Rhodoferax sp.]